MYLLVEIGLVQFERYGNLMLFKTYKEAKSELNKRIKEIRTDLDGDMFEEELTNDYFCRNNENFDYYTEVWIEQIKFNEEKAIL